MLKSYGVGVCGRPCGDVQAAMWWGGGPCDFSVSPSPFGLDFGTLDFGTSDLGLTIFLKINSKDFQPFFCLLSMSMSIKFLVKFDPLLM